MPADGQLDWSRARWDPSTTTASHPSRVCACSVRVPTLVTQCGGPFTMAKAILGHVGGPDPRMVAEMRRLQQRVRDLEAELARLQEENNALVAGGDHDLLAPRKEAALT